MSSTEVPKKSKKEKSSSASSSSSPPPPSSGATEKVEKAEKTSKKSSKSSKTTEGKSSGSQAPERQPSSAVVSTMDSNLAFEAGMIFNRFVKDGKGVIGPDDFLKIWREAHDSSSSSRSLPVDENTVVNTISLNQLPHQQQQQREQQKLVNFEEPSYLPMEVVTGRLLTHFDETAGVAIPSSAVEQHRRMGNTVRPLVETYKQRYERLRLMLTGRLLPRREHILQLRRQLEGSSVDVSLARKAIEKETTTDAEQIVERLRTVESMRQSNIRQQMLQLDAELENIERVVRKVELANEKSFIPDASTGIVITSVTTTTTTTTPLAPTSNLDSNNNNNSNVGVESVKGVRAASMVELIQQFNDISSTIERLATKALTVQVDFPSTDFPRETAQRLQKLSHFEQCMHALDVKDAMIWTLLKERDEAKELLQQEKILCQKYASELSDWATMTQQCLNKNKIINNKNALLQKQNTELLAILRKNNILLVSDDNEEEEEEEENSVDDDDNDDSNNSDDDDDDNDENV